MIFLSLRSRLSCLSGRVSSKETHTPLLAHDTVSRMIELDKNPYAASRLYLRYSDTKLPAKCQGIRIQNDWNDNSVPQTRWSFETASTPPEGGARIGLEIPI
jgi:hypothetical protein